MKILSKSSLNLIQNKNQKDLQDLATNLIILNYLKVFISYFFLKSALKMKSRFCIIAYTEILSIRMCL